MSGRQRLDEQLNHICINSGTIMRSDHTYKVTKAMTVWTKGKPVKLHSSLLIVMDEFSKIMGYEVVPHDDAAHVHAVYKRILTTPGKTSSTWPRAIATDNCGRDTKGFTQLIATVCGSRHKCDFLQVLHNI